MNLKIEGTLWAIVSIPFLYLIILWQKLPEKVPLHWGIRGEIDRYGDKGQLIWIPVLLPLLTHLLFLVIPKIDPKKKLDILDRSYTKLRFGFILFMSFLATLLLFMTKEGASLSPSLFNVFIGLLVLFLGYLLKTVKPNYFIGIRTPWTLEDEQIWKKTHLVGGKLFFVAGVVIVFCAILLPADLSTRCSLVLISVIVLVSIFYSYYLYRQKE